VGSLLLEILPLAVIAAVSPVVLMLALALLDSDKPIVRLAAYAAGVIGTTVVLIVAGLVVIHVQRDGYSAGPLGSKPVHVVVALVLIAAAFVLIFRPPNPQRSEELRRRVLEGNRPWFEFAAVGVAVMITNASTFVVLIAILRDVAAAQVGLPGELLPLAVVIMVASLPATAPLAAALVGGRRLRARLATLGDLTARYGRFVMACLFLLYGAKDLVQIL
jgi:hypothetical protein